MAECNRTLMDEHFLVRCLVYVHQIFEPSCKYKGSSLRRKCKNCKGYSGETNLIHRNLYFGNEENNLFDFGESSARLCENCCKVHVTPDYIGFTELLIASSKETLKQMRNIPGCPRVESLHRGIEHNTRTLRNLKEKLYIISLRRDQLNIKTILTLLSHRNQHRLPHDLIRVLKSFLY